jgi:hypothetical protein
MKSEMDVAEYGVRKFQELHNMLLHHFQVVDPRCRTEINNTSVRANIGLDARWPTSRPPRARQARIPENQSAYR